MLPSKGVEGRCFVDLEQPVGGVIAALRSGVDLHFVVSISEVDLEGQGFGWLRGNTSRGLGYDSTIEHNQASITRINWYIKLKHSISIKHRERQLKVVADIISHTTITDQLVAHLNKI